MDDPSPTTPLLERGRLLVGATNDIDRDLACAKTYGFGIELQQFSMPPLLGTPWRAEAERLLPDLHTVRGRIGLHGPFIDTVHASPDPAIQQLCRDKYVESFELAAYLGAQYVVLHSQFNTMLRLPDYPRFYHDASIAFWPGVIEEAVDRGLTIYVENMFDISPTPMANVVAALNHPAFRVCLDVSHAIIHSDLPFSAWIDELGPYVGHIHINDCDGVYDLHLPLGDGSLDLRDAISRIESKGCAPTYTLETHASAEESAAFLGIAPL